MLDQYRTQNQEILLTDLISYHSANVVSEYYLNAE